MEVQGMEEEATNHEGHLTSAAAFVEGGIQDACDDSCSICLESFCESDPSTVTTCRHEFHLQCILEWCQRSSQCPMCWQSVSLKDPTSQELLEAVEQERGSRLNPARNGTIFHHPALGHFELPQLAADANDAELEERIIQHLAAAAAMRRAHHISRREGQRSRSSAHGGPHFVVFSTNPNGSPDGPVSASLAEVREGNEPVASPIATRAIRAVSASLQNPQFPSVYADGVSAPASGSRVISLNQHGNSNNNRSASQSSPLYQDRAGPSELQSISESLKSRFNAVSMRYKESISKSTRGWKERLFSRNTSVSDIGSEVPREVNVGMASVSRLMERLQTKETRGDSCASVSSHQTDRPITEQSNPNDAETSGQSPVNGSDAPAPPARGSAGSVSN